jgi:hypothetical protein
MGDLQVTSISISELIGNLKKHEWQVPQFQREYVWTIGDVIDFINSIIHARPIGMVTIWEQSDGNAIELGALSLPDKESGTNEETRKKITDDVATPKNIYAVLDGLQRCTSVALAFAGFHTNNKDFRTSGRFYLDVSAKDPSEQIKFIKELDVIKKELNKDNVCFSHGYFPLSSNSKDEEFLNQWMRYTQEIKNPSNYPDGKMPESEELDRRDAILKNAFDGLIKTKLAVYIVPDNYSLADICDIFQTLNTTGTKVSTVDLIHSWLYSDTQSSTTGPIHLRDWIDDFGQKDGAIGWANASDRPELIVQMATACHVALEEKAKPRKVGKTSLERIESIKSSDLLATPTQHWKLIIDNDDKLAGYLKDFQLTVAGGLFPWQWCPYPVVSTIYVALRFHYSSDNPSTHQWSIDDLNALFRAFFWQNSLTNRYDQGFLTQLGTDINKLKEFLQRRKDFATGNNWASAINSKLTELIGKPLPSHDDIFYLVTKGKHAGAIQKALTLPMLAEANKDLLIDTIILKYTGSDTQVQLHHIYPRDWCNNNIVGDLARLLDPKKRDRVWSESISNLMPLSRESNNSWKTQNPGQILVNRQLGYDQCSAILRHSFIDEESYNLLIRGAEGMEGFFNHRAELLTTYFLEKMKITI